MNIKEAIKLLKQEPDFSLSYYKREYAIDLLLAEYEKQQKEIEKLKDEYKREVFEHQEFVEDTKVAVQDYIKKDKIKEKIEEITSYAYTSAEERDCQDYAIQVLKELIGEINK